MSFEWRRAGGALWVGQHRLLGTCALALWRLTRWRRRLRELLDQRATRPLVDGSVWTFNVAPDSVYGANLNYRFDTFGLVTTAESFSNWTLEVVNLMIPQD